VIGEVGNGQWANIDALTGRQCEDDEIGPHDRIAPSDEASRVRRLWHDTLVIVKGIRQ
jgi:hypothetical protein